MEAGVGNRLVADAESKYRRVVLGNKEAVATLHLAHGNQRDMTIVARKLKEVDWLED